MVEQNRGGSYTQVVYGPDGGKLALMSGSSLQKAFVPLPAGTQAVYNGSGLAYYRHADWLGTSRLASTPSRTLYYDGAYAPYGESYSETGTTDRDFTGQNQDAHSGLYDFMYREYHSVSGRWSSPDPAGLAAVDPSNPQSLNRYAYALNAPTVYVDPLGLQVARLPDPDGGGRSNPFGGLTCMIDGLIADCGTVMPFVNLGLLAPCPDANCRGFDANGTYKQFIATPQGVGFSSLISVPTLKVTITGEGTVYKEGKTSRWIFGPLTQLYSVPWSLSWTIPIAPVPGALGVGPAGSLTYIPSSRTLCLSGGLGVSAAREATLSVGIAGFPMYKWPDAARETVSGWSISGGYTLPNGVGVQLSFSPSTRVFMVAPSVGVPGIGGSVTHAQCTSF